MVNIVKLLENLLKIPIVVRKHPTFADTDTALVAFYSPCP